jgi:starch phosphorylase
MFAPKIQKRGASELLAEKTIAYFCAEYAITDALPIYSGGLGVLAGDLVQEAAREKLPFVSVGLFYKKGYFHQWSDESGQHEVIQEIDPLHVPLDLMRDAHGETLLVEVPVQERIVYAQVWRFPLEANSLYLLDTDHWKNSPEDRLITDQLYSGDQAKRLQQELVLGIGGLRALTALGTHPALFHMNEGHSAFLALELLSDTLRSNAGMRVEAALAIIKNKLVFTNHTLVAAGNDLFPHEMASYYLGKYAHQNKIGIETILNLGSLDGKPGFFSMTMFALRTAVYSNAVSKLHAEKAKDLWPAYPLLPVTNGVHLPAWIAPEMQTVLNAAVPGWQADPENPLSWKKLQNLEPAVLWNTHTVLKERMLDEVYARTGIRLDPEVLTVVWARRFATYKRPDLLFSDLERLKGLLFSTDKPIQIIVSGKSHPADLQGKEIIAHIEHLANYDLKHRAVFVDDYSISLAKYLVAGADIWLNTPVFGLEASGTSGMKAGSNGVLQFTVPDGWAYEVNWNAIGFTLPKEQPESELYSILEKKIIPTYYSRNRAGIPEGWVTMMKGSMMTIAPRFSSARMVKEYVDTMYLPALAK